MLYPKPKDISYSQMCIYVDAHAYDENKTEEEKEKIYKYIYWVSHMMALKLKLFSNYQYYDEFSLWYTTQIYSRLENPKQYQLNEDGTPKMEKIKSILNYIKNTIAQRKITFEQQEYSQVISYTNDYYVQYNYSLSDKINESLDNLYRVEFDLCLENCTNSIKKFLNRIPYDKNSKIFYNIYLSCLLTFLNSVTLPNKEIKKLSQLKFQENIDPVRVISKELKDPVILYHLPNDMHDYIYVLYKQIRHEIASELEHSSNSYVGTNAGLYSIMMSELNGYDEWSIDED